MITVNSREFRDKQAAYLDRADNGEEIFVQRGKRKKYKLVAVVDDDTVVKREHILTPDVELARAITAEELLIGIEEDIKELFKKRRLNK